MSSAFPVLTSVIMLVEVFLANVLLGILFFFVPSCVQTRKSSRLFLTMVFFAFLVFVVITLVGQFFIRFGRLPTELIFIERWKAVSLLVGGFFLFLFINDRSKIKGDKGVVVPFSIVFAALIVVVFISPISLLPQGIGLDSDASFNYLSNQNFSSNLPKLVWFGMWGILGVAAFLSIFFTGKEESGQKILYLYIAVSALFFVIAYLLYRVSQRDAAMVPYLFSWVFMLLGSMAAALGEGIDPGSKLALNPLNYFRTRLLFKVIFGFVLLIIILFGATHIVTTQMTRAVFSKNILRAGAYAEINRLESESLIFVIGGIVLTILTGFIFTAMLERPLRRLAQGTKAVASGDLSYRVNSRSIDELGSLADAYNQMTKDLKETQNRLILSEKMIALGNMAAGMAHEIRNPLVSLRTFTQLLGQKWDDGEFRNKFSTIVPREIERINRIAESLLKFGRPWQAEVKEVDITSVLEEVLLLFEPEMKKNNVALNVKFADVPTFKGDAPQLVQAFTNVVKNAIEAMSDKKEGTLFVETEYILALKLKGREYSINEMSWGSRIEEKPYIMVKITDTGGGVPQGKLRNIFDPFFTSKVYGTGMGLPITLRIIEEHHGTIKIKNRPNEGATFIVYLPQEREEQAEELEA